MAQDNIERTPTTDTYGVSKIETILKADEARLARREKAARHLQELPILEFELAEFENQEMIKLMQPEVVEVRVPSDNNKIQNQYHGNLGGGSPSNPLRIGGLVHK